MIFDNDKVTKLAIEWQKDPRKKTLDEIIKESDSLIEVIVSRFDSSFREELIQECRLVIISKLSKFDENRGKLHAWLTSVITNHCINYVSSSSRVLNLDDLGIEDVDCENNNKFDYDIGALVTRNRKRFPSLPVTIIDDMTRYICLSAMFAVPGKSRGVIRNITNKYKISRYTATVVYHSTMMHMRCIHIEECDVSKVEEPEELSLLKDLEDIVGNELYRKLSVLFSGMYIKF